MTGTIVYSNVAHYDPPRVPERMTRPHIAEFSDMQKMRSKITDLQYFLYRPDYILVEFNGYIYDVTNPNSAEGKKVIRIIDEWIDEHYMKESIL